MAFTYVTLVDHFTRPDYPVVAVDDDNWLSPAAAQRPPEPFTIAGAQLVPLETPAEPADLVVWRRPGFGLPRLFEAQVIMAGLSNSNGSIAFILGSRNQRWAGPDSKAWLVHFFGLTDGRVEIRLADGDSLSDCETKRQGMATGNLGDTIGCRIVGNTIEAWYRPQGGSWTQVITYDTSADYPIGEQETWYAGLAAAGVTDAALDLYQEYFAARVETDDQPAYPALDIFSHSQEGATPENWGDDGQAMGLTLSQQAVTGPGGGLWMPEQYAAAQETWATITAWPDGQEVALTLYLRHYIDADDRVYRYRIVFSRYSEPVSYGLHIYRQTGTAHGDVLLSGPVATQIFTVPGDQVWAAIDETGILRVYHRMAGRTRWDMLAELDESDYQHLLPLPGRIGLHLAAGILVDEFGGGGVTVASAPTFAAGLQTDFPVMAGDTLEVKIEADGQGKPTSMRLSAEPVLPEAVFFKDNGDGSLLLRWTPTAADTGRLLPMTVTAANEDGEATLALTARCVPSFPTTPVLDTFDRPDTADLGANWLVEGGGIPVAVNGFSLSGHAALAAITPETPVCVGLWAAVPDSLSAEAYFTLRTAPVTDAQIALLLHVSVTDSTMTGLTLTRNDDGIPEASLTTGGSVLLPDVDAGSSLGLLYHAASKLLVGYHRPPAGKWAPVISAILGEITRPGYMGLWVIGPTGEPDFSPITVLIDDFGGGAYLDPAADTEDETVPEALITRLRQMTDEPAGGDYSTDRLRSLILEYPLTDFRGIHPYALDPTTMPPRLVFNIDWMPTFDLHAAAADVWQEKAARLSDSYDFSADGASHTLSQKYAHALEQARYHRSRRKARSIPFSGMDRAKLLPSRRQIGNWVDNT